MPLRPDPFSVAHLALAAQAGAGAQVLHVVLGDQLNQQHSWFRATQSGAVYLLAEARSETDYARHHIQKVVGFFLAMRAFAHQLAAAGHRVVYVPLDDPANQGSLAANIEHVAAALGVAEIVYQQPDEYRVDQAMVALAQRQAARGVAVSFCDSEHFLCSRNAVREQFAGKRQYLMETFYRAMRVRHGLLMDPADGTAPLGGRWNYDAENRKKLPPSVALPPLPAFRHDATALVQMLTQQGVQTMGRLDPAEFSLPVTREECLQLLDHFVHQALPAFGTYEDAMTRRDGTLFHSRLSFALNTKLLSPLEVVQAAIAHALAHPEIVSLSQIEGFVRQIVGWREYMRGLYWAEMPSFATRNYFNHVAELPAWYWTGEVKMACLHHAVNHSLDHAYAHHIQRLMVTGAFGLMLGVHPDAMDAWYLGVYIDALEWVEITNTRGMSQFADGGIVGTKPYLGTANYIHKMSDYCDGCAYDRTIRYGTGADGRPACPFNSLYWDFYLRHEGLLRKNPRIGMMYPLLDKMTTEEKGRIREQAAAYQARVEEL
ncbi:cryptochrome/photolyase family protein [Hymenobacter sp.]|uniref:cryptochrome/photolyase family protein n=1 Tax=Hymenobacter sp. TaxID=1898978 RepID=UPI00286A91AE|nr:cryptochrome/photolyase family protein [Hymenobacter sp.]